MGNSCIIQRVGGKGREGREGRREGGEGREGKGGKERAGYDIMTRK